MATAAKGHPPYRRAAICRTFRIEGLSVTKDASRALESVLRREPHPKDALHRIVEAVKLRIDRAQMTRSVVDVDTITDVVSDLTKDSDDLAQESLQVYSAFEMPRLKFNVARKEFYHVPASRYSLHGSAQDKIDMVRDRFALLQQRLYRNKAFSPPVVGAGLGAAKDAKRDYVQVTPIESLRGGSGQKCVLGTLSQLQEGRWFLEDSNSSVALDLSDVTLAEGLFTERCVVVAQGELVDDIFKVAVMGFPPPEEREKTLQHMGNLPVLGVVPASQDFAHMRQMEKEADDAAFVILSDVHLDKPTVMLKLEQLFRGFAAAPPTAFVFIGNFTSRPFGQGYDDRDALQRHFDELAALVAGFPELRRHSRFVFVPGPSDAGGSGLLPRPPLPVIFTKRLRSVLPTAVFSSNPCRIRFFTQEIVIFRDNLLSKMCRHSILPPAGEVDVTDHLVKTVLEQGHLCPLHQNAKPVYWGFDHSLWLYPLPDVCVFADHYDQYLQDFEGVSALNPGSFPADFSFVFYRPSTKTTEFSRIS